ncbi:MAG: hypothetical protein HN380_21775, partial [Victivallales bacterium]|nr:hypothetical protein [Victivallales bacterium]
EGTGLVFIDKAPGEVLRKDRRVPTPIPDLLGGIALTGRFSRDDTHWQDRYKGKKPGSEEAFRSQFFAAYQLGRGRAVDFTGKFSFGDHWSRLSFARPYTPEYRLDADYALAELGRAVLWAGGKESEARFIAEPPARLAVPWGATAGKTVAWSFDIAGEKRDTTVSWRVRTLAGDVVHAAEKLFPDASGIIECTALLPDLGAGNYYLDVFVDSPRGRENYGFSALIVSTPYAVTIEQEQEGVEVGQALGGTVLVERSDTAAQAPAPTAIVLDLLDSEDRIVDRAVHEGDPSQPIRYSFASDAHYPVGMRVRATVQAGGRAAGSGSATHYLLQRRQDRFNVVLWGSFGGAYGHWGYRKLWQTGVTSAMSRAGSAANLTSTPFIAAWGNWKGELDGQAFTFDQRATKPKPHPETKVPTMVPTCWNDSQRFEKMLDVQDKHWQAGMQKPVFVYNMYDEGPHSGCCLAPPCLEAYRTWLKERYGGDLKALNTEWLSDYRTWDQVTVLKENDTSEKEAKKQGIYARWSDRKHFSEVNFCRTILAGQSRRAKLIDPQARIGFEGSGGFGMDFDELIGNTGFWCPYDGLQTEMVRSLKPPGYIHSFWVGYQKTADPLISRTWRMVVNGAPSVWWWMLKGRGRFHGWLGPNFMPYPENQKYLDECTLPLRRGLGDLLINLDMPHDGMAVYYSVAAAHAGGIGDSAAYNSVAGAHANVVKLAEDCGLQWVYTTRKRLLDGDLARRGIKLLVLPFHQALDQDEVDVLRSFVQAGGTVLADLRPGVYSGHCRPLEHGPAEALFGIERTGKGKPVPIEGTLTVNLNGQDIPISVRNNRADGEIKATTATVGGELSGAPLFLVNRIGKGSAILLNFHVTQYNGEREMSKGAKKRAFFRALTAAIGVQPPLLRRGTDGGEVLRTETITWRKGNVTLHALYRDGGTDASGVDLELADDAFVFDLRRGERGKTRRIRIDALKPGYAQFLAVYPYDPGKPKVKVSGKRAKAGDTVRFAISMSGVPGSETGVFSYETRLMDPSGKRVDVIPWSVQGVGGKTATHVRFAHNDPDGIWQLRVREVTTGRETVAEIKKGP